MHFAARFADDRLLSKLRAIDAKAQRKGLASLDAARNPLIGLGMEHTPDGKVTKNSYGLFHLSWMAEKHPEWPARIAAELEEIRANIQAAHKKKLKFLIWAGMGGSAEDKSMFQAAGLLAKGPRCYVLDSTDPGKLKAIVADVSARSGGSLKTALESTLVVGQALGMTSYEPVVNLETLYKMYENLGIDSRANFVYMTLPGSLLDQFAGPRGYRKVELQLDNGNSTSGRHSGPLTRGSLYPLGLAGIDLAAWMQGTFLTEQEIHTAWTLSSFLQAQGLAGRDKVTLLASKSLAAASLWTKQNFEESLGKSEALGIKIVIGEPFRMTTYRPAKDARQDRVFLLIERKGEPALDRVKLNLLKRAGYPVAVLTLEKDAPLSRYMQMVHYAVFGLGWLREMNFVTQPGVELYKAITNPLHQNGLFQGGIEKTPEWRQLLSSPRQIKWRGGVTLHYDRLPCGFEMQDRNAAGAYAALLQQLSDAGTIEYGELSAFADTRFDKRGQGLRKVMDKAAGAIFRDRLRVPVDVYEGPAMNHSYHEMIIGHGRCLSTVLLPLKAESIPEAGHTAGYHRAQFLATQMALEQRARLVVSITIKDTSEASLRALEEFFQAAAASLRRG
jgi:transaldolase/glucose-6-phosphate isomerase